MRSEPFPTRFLPWQAIVNVAITRSSQSNALGPAKVPNIWCNVEPSRCHCDWLRTRNELRGPRVFDTLLKTLARHTCVTHRPQGVAFLTATQELYRLTEVAYACTNIPILKGERRYSHCVYTCAFMGQWISPQVIATERDFTTAVDGR